MTYSVLSGTLCLYTTTTQLTRLTDLDESTKTKNQLNHMHQPYTLPFLMSPVK